MNNEAYQNIFDLALKGDGKLLKGYSLFHNYSFFNQMYAMWQMLGRGLEITPLAPYKKWLELGRQVKKGEKALEICIPRIVKDKKTKENVCIGFIFLNKAFAMSQTDGEDLNFPAIEFNFEKCLENLGVKQVPFDLLDGNVQGFARKGEIAVNPLAQLKAKTFWHELAHILLHLEGDSEFIDDKTTEKSLKEVEAESVALCVSLALGITENIEYCRGYISNWLKTDKIPDESIKKIFSATNKILVAGT